MFNASNAKKSGKLSLFSILIFFPVICIADPTLSNEVLKNAAAKNIQLNTTMYDGLDFPKVDLKFLANTSSQLPKATYNPNTLCKIGTQRTIDFGPFAHDGARRAKHDWSETRRQRYFSSDGWVPDHPILTITSRGSPSSFEITKIPKNMFLNTNEDYLKVDKEIKDYVISLNVPQAVKADLTAKIDEYNANFRSMGDSLMSSHGGFLITTTVSGTGVFNFKNPYSWVNGTFAMTETCVPPQLTDSKLLLESYTAWVNSTVDSIKKSVDLPKED